MPDLPDLLSALALVLLVAYAARGARLRNTRAIAAMSDEPEPTDGWENEGGTPASAPAS
jgi:hypothetical protein